MGHSRLMFSLFQFWIRFQDYISYNGNTSICMTGQRWPLYSKISNYFWSYTTRHVYSYRKWLFLNAKRSDTHTWKRLSKVAAADSAILWISQYSYWNLNHHFESHLSETLHFLAAGKTLPFLQVQPHKIPLWAGVRCFRTAAAHLPEGYGLSQYRWFLHGYRIPLQSKRGRNNLVALKSQNSDEFQSFAVAP